MPKKDGSLQRYSPFLYAKPVWAAGRENEKNFTLGFYAKISSCEETTVLRIATSGVYRVFINNRFFFYGPARCAHGFFRVDELPVPFSKTETHFAIEVLNPCVYNYDIIRQPGFLQAEIVADGQCRAATGLDGFSVYELTERVRKIQRYSSQRTFAEGYRLRPGFADWRMGQKSENALFVKLEETEKKALVPRRIPLHLFEDIRFDRLLSSGTILPVKPRAYHKHRSLTAAGNVKNGGLDGFSEEELIWHLSDEVQEFRTGKKKEREEPYGDIVELSSGEFVIFSLTCEKTGFLTAKITCKKSGTLYFLTDELLQDGDVDPFRLECCNILKIEMTPGEYPFQAIHPTGFRYLKALAPSGQFSIENLCVKEYGCPQPVTFQYNGKDPKIRTIFHAAKETFLQNTADILMDCPTRERAGWLCDSFFTARAEWLFTGDNVIETNFLENYGLPEDFPNIPKGMLPMCYPADHISGRFIPNWAMWFVLELEDRLFHRKGDAEFIFSFRERVYGIVDWLRQYENEDGLLEKLPGWVFVEWSKANDFVWDINFPTNMLYAKMLEAAAHIFDDDALFKKSVRLKETVRSRSFHGSFFTDREVSDAAGVLHPSDECTETCQYYAFFCGVATPETHPRLWEFLLNAKREELQKKLYPSNAFIGKYLRLFLLKEYGFSQKALTEIQDEFYKMAVGTGTLWEHLGDYASCNHGFASAVAALLV